MHQPSETEVTGCPSKLVCRDEDVAGSPRAPTGPEAADRIEDRRRNPSNYAIMAISEWASMIGGQVVQYGQEDPYGHRKLGGIGQLVGEALRQLTGIDIIYQQLAYLMRAGPPDSLDRMVTSEATAVPR